MHRLSSAARRSLIIVLGSLTALLVALNFGMFLNHTLLGSSIVCAEEARVVVVDDIEVSIPSEAEMQRVEEEMARVEVEMRRVERELRQIELEGVEAALDAARDAMARKEMHLKHPGLPTTLSREGSLHIQLHADEVQLN